MTIFSCSACGGHAFKLSPDLKQAHCEDCKRSLGSWEELRAKIEQSLRGAQPRGRTLAQFRSVALH